MAKKSFYVFLTALLGVLLFLIIDRIVVFFYLFLLEQGIIGTSLTYVQFAALDYSVLTIVLMFGCWYGIWLGLYWFRAVYEEGSHGGFIDHMARNYFPSGKNKNLGSRMVAVKQRLESDLWQLEDLADSSLIAAKSSPVPVKRKVVRRAVLKKPKILK